MRRGGTRWSGKAGGRGEKEDFQEEHAGGDLVASCKNQDGKFLAVFGPGTVKTNAWADPGEGLQTSGGRV